jgi:hypothetical protein
MEAASKKPANTNEEANQQEGTRSVVPLEEESIGESNSNGKDLPPTAFPFSNDLLFGKDQKRDRFNHSDESIAYVCKHLRRHGFGFLLEETCLDVYQLEILMGVSWKILKAMSGNKDYPSNDAFVKLASFEGFNFTNDRDEESSLSSQDKDDSQPSPIEESCLLLLPRDTIKHRTVSPAANHAAPLTTQTSHPSLPIWDCTPKHRRSKPNVKGLGYTGCILSNMPTFVAFVELMLAYHAWCHYSGNLPLEYQEDHNLVEFAKRMLVQYQDAVLYHGDNSIDSATCKLHSQLHDQTQQFGDQMGHNSATGERGLKDWAKFRSKTALKHGHDKFTQSTSSRVSESLLVNRVLDQASRVQDLSSISTTILVSSPTRRRMSHFRFERNVRPSSDTRVLSIDRRGQATVPNGKTGYIQPQILQAIDDIERHQGNEQEFFEIWCEARLSSGEFVRCWPQYRGAEGSQYDWIMVSFGTSNGPSIEYPAKLIARYEDSTDGTFKALIHSVEWKLNTNQEGPHGDSHLVTHYRLQFDNQGNPNLMLVPFDTIVRSVVGYEAQAYKEPLILRVRGGQNQRKHTVMIIRPREEWAKLYLDWMRELRTRQATVIGRDKNRLDF